MDKIELCGLRFFAYHGVLDEEAKQGQNFSVDATLVLDTSFCEDDLSRTVDYGAVASELYRLGTTTRFQLLEALANHMAEQILWKFPRIARIEITVHKPEAPIPLSFADVCVSVARGYVTAYLGLGSNLGDREAALHAVQDAVTDTPGLWLLAASREYETAPYGNLNQPHFLNAVLKIRTTHTPRKLLLFCEALEAAQGRVKTEHWGPRTLDVDILLYGDTVLESETLTIPHPDLHRRDFVLRPLCELAPYLHHPRFHAQMRTLLARLESAGDTP